MKLKINLKKLSKKINNKTFFLKKNVKKMVIYTVQLNQKKFQI